MIFIKILRIFKVCTSVLKKTPYLWHLSLIRQPFLKYSEDQNRFVKNKLLVVSCQDS